MTTMQSQCSNTPARWSARWITTLLMLGSLGLAQFATAEDTEEKGIRLRGDEAAGLQVIFNPVKAKFRVGEPLRFTIRGNQRFFLYLYSVDPQTGKTVLLLPNRRQKGNQYEAHRTYRVPNPNVEFYGDEARTERIIMLASTRYLDIDTARYKQAGDFFSAKIAEVENQFEAKGIRIRGPQRRQQPAGTVVKELDIQIAGHLGGRRDARTSAGGGEMTGQPTVFVSTRKDQYLTGEKVQITFGADQQGWVHLYTADPQGVYSLLTRAAVNGRELRQVTARAEAPAGDHALVAVYTQDRRFNERLLDDIEDNGATKDLRLIGDNAIPFAVRHIRIED
jgi:hypothetical protein